MADSSYTHNSTLSVLYNSYCMNGYGFQLWYISFFYKEDFIENQQNRRLTKTIYRAMYKIYNPPPTSKYRHYT